MDIYLLKNMQRGWFIGDFEPTLIKTTAFEVAVKIYQKGDHEAKHYHKIATEITAIVSGCVRMNQIRVNEGEIVVLQPGEVADFECLSNVARTVVIKFPGAENDKFFANN